MARRDAAAGLRAWVDAVVRSGLGTPDEVWAQVVEAIGTDLAVPDPAQLAGEWIAAAQTSWHDAAQSWPATTDFDRLQQVFGALVASDVVVLQGCADHWAARDALQRQDPVPQGVVWFTAPDVWHAVDHGMLEVNLWHGTTANAAPGDALLDDVLAAFAGAGLAARFDEGRIEVSAHWQRRPPGLEP